MGDEIKWKESQDQVIIEEKTNIKSKLGEYAFEYHDRELKQNEKIINEAIKMIWFGIFLLAAGMIISVFKENSWFAMLPGAFVEIFSGTMLCLVNKSEAGKQKYFEELIDMEHEKSFLEELRNIEDPELKKNILTEMAKKYHK